jgi:replicative DNA helicase
MELLLTMVKTELKNSSDNALKQQVKDFLVRVECKKDLGDLGYVKERALDFCKRAKLQIALEVAVDHVATENYEKIVDIVKKAVHAGNSHSPGLDLFELDDIDSRYSETYRRTVPTGVPELDQKKILNGGLGAGEIGFVVAGAGVGKSHILIDFGANALKIGKNVIHYTFELNERMLGIRYDSNLSNTPSLECFENKHAIKKLYQDNKDTFGRLIVKYFPTGQASCQTLRAHMDKLANNGFVPDLIIIDYAGIMRSADRNDLLRLELKKVCEELRGMAGELDVPIWSALQSNKEGANADIVDLSNMAESYGQAAIADFVIGLSRQSAQKATGFGNLFIAKNRAGIDGLKYAIHLDTSRSKIKVLTDSEAMDMAHKKEEDALTLMRKKFSEISKEKEEKTV